MRSSGADSTDLLVRARSALLDALEALDRQRQAVVVVGAQAVYLRTGGIDVALAEATKDSDLVLDQRELTDDPLIEIAMKNAGFLPGLSAQPGAWVNAQNIPVDLMVPEQLAGGGGSKARSARIPPHDRKVARRARGLEAAVVDFDHLPVSSLDHSDSRVFVAKVAGPAALLVAKLHKIAERRDSSTRLNDKDAHDTYRLFYAIETSVLHDGIVRLLDDELSREVTETAIGYLRDLFADSPDALGSFMAGRAEEGVGEPEQVAASVSILAGDLIEALGAGRSGRG